MSRIEATNYPEIAKHLPLASIVAVGESTHGTHEFFETKIGIFKQLISDYGFNTLFFESPDDSCEAISAYLKTGVGEIDQLINGLFYFYRSTEILNFLKWMRDNYEKYPVSIIGLDERRYVDDYAINYDLAKMNVRDKRMALVVKRVIDTNPDLKCMIWAHDTHVAAYINAPLSFKPQYAPMGRHLRRWYKNKYYCIAQLFGHGEFSAELIGEATGLSKKGELVIHPTPPLPDDFWEHAFCQKVLHPGFLPRGSFEVIASAHDIRKKRSLGWGVKTSAINDAFIWFDLYHAYDAVIFFPHATASHHIS